MTGDPDISDFLGGDFGPRGMQVTTSSGEQAYKYSGAATQDPSKHVWICGVPRRYRAIPFSPNSESSLETAAAASRHRGKKMAKKLTIPCLRSAGAHHVPN